MKTGENPVFIGLGEEATKEYKFDAKDNDLPVNAILGIASKVDGQDFEPLTIDKTKVTFDSTKFEFNEADSTLKVLTAGKYTFTVKFEAGLPVSMVVTDYVAPTTVNVTINCTKDVGMGNGLYIVGSFSDWKLDPAYRLDWTEGNVWTKTFALTKDVAIEFKLAIGPYEAEKGTPVGESNWETGFEGNRTLTPTEAKTLNLTWGSL